MLFTVLSAFAAPHHALTVTLEPDSGTLTATDALTGIQPGAVFALHAGLTPSVHTKGWTLTRVATEDRSVPIETWRLDNTKKKPRWPIELHYGGVIAHPLGTQGEEYQRSFSETPGTIQQDGVYLAPSTYWLPDFEEPATYAITPTVPEGWSTVVSGNPTTTGWESVGATSEAYLVAAGWTHTASEIETPSGTRGIDIYLREPDPGLAFRYTAATGRYLTLYESMLTPYPFDRFALVENFWDTGYGMPGFTLLGPQVIRFPWILTSSYPHEILHTWWGNSATIDPAGGNWAEGLTAYMADHMFAEHRGQDAMHRRNTLKKFTDIAADQDFPLVEFQGRTSAATEAVGYGKSLMFWHMVRRHIGDEAFLKGLTAFHDAFRSSPAGFADLEPYLSTAAGEDLGPFFEAWTTRAGALRLTVSDVKTESAGDGWVVTGSLGQGEPTKPAWVPLQLTTASGKTSIEHIVALEGTTTSFRIEVPADRGEPLRLDVDPAFDVMRVLDPMEVPPALTTVLGEDQAVFVLPSAAPEAERAAWAELAAAWARPGEPTLLEDDAVDAPPPGSWMLGWSNLHGPRVAEAVADNGVKVDTSGLTWESETFDRTHSIVLIARSDDPERAVGWVTAGPVEAIPGLARKLPHYTKYSLLAFAGTAPDNVAKASWQATRSPLTVGLGTEPLVTAQRSPPREPLAEMPPRFDAEALRAEAAWFADPARQGRGIGSEGLAEATDRIVASLESIGLAPERQTWTEPVEGTDIELTNVVVTLPGNGRPLAPVVIMAHVDHLGLGEHGAREGNAGKLHPGADDNASGVAVALGLVRYLASEPARPRPVTFVFTTAEESGLRGAKHWLAEGGEGFACLAIDTVGRLGKDGITILGAESAREIRFLFMGVGYTTGAKFGFAQPGLAGSDHAACHDAGIPGVQITTGATPDYHAPSDTVDQLSAEGLATVADATLEAIAYLAERTDPLTVQLGGDSPAPAAGERKASLGTMPDFTFGGPGVKVADVMPDSAAGAAGMKPGDILLALDGTEVADLRSFSDLLKSKKPGDVVEVRFRRGKEQKTVKATLKAR